MNLPHALVSQFAKITNDESPKKEITVYGKAYKESNNKVYVILDGSTERTPAISTVSIQNGDRVTVMLKNHTAVITGNATSPSASINYLESFQITVGNQIDEVSNQLDEKIEDATSGSNLITKINMTPNDILIQATHINLKGAVTADSIAVGALEVGKNVTMGPDTKISWNNVTDRDYVATIFDVPSESRITEITNNSISTAKIRCDQLEAGTWTGGGNPYITVEKVTASIGTGMADVECTGRYAHITAHEINLNAQIVKANGSSIMTYSDLRSYARSDHSHSGSDISGGYPSVSSIYITNPGSASKVALYRSTESGIVGIPTSSRRYKNSIDYITEPHLNPENLYDLPVRQYKYNVGHFGEENFPYDEVQVGFIAEEVYEHYPKAAVIMNNRIETWEVRDILPPMLQLIQNQKMAIDNLERRVKELESREV